MNTLTRFTAVGQRVRITNPDPGHQCISGMRGSVASITTRIDRTEAWVQMDGPVPAPLCAFRPTDAQGRARWVRLYCDECTEVQP